MNTQRVADPQNDAKMVESEYNRILDWQLTVDSDKWPSKYKLWEAISYEF